ncbi:hypothetical protein Clacol_005674 [Clathrus columnatus]|uniref:Ubiquinone biosynthesis monooxygenase COQ6, mitochondrial n=1 Tax=Clathrus columnatus TaxID=1419009 RepID=A0AAV5AEN6_9AGAM|nr:hypothetical protein Clacol_005674 [Clathrus columnatus]
MLRFLTTSGDNTESVDIAIVGGGPAGLALACALSSSQAIRESLKITLIEGGDLSKVRTWQGHGDIYSNRVSSITNASRQFLEDINVWEKVESERTTPIEEMQVWDGISDARIVFAANELSSVSSQPIQEMARLTENLNLQRALLQCLEAYPGVSLLDKTKVDAINQMDNGWPVLSLANGRKIQTRLLVGADGFNSPVRSFANISSFGWSYDTQAIVATLSHIPRITTEYQGPNTTAYQRFLKTGPIAFLPLSPTASSLVWSTTPSLAKVLLQSETGVLAAMINAAFRLPYISLDYLQDAILQSHSQGTPLTTPAILDEIRWREKSHGIDIQSAHSSCQPVDELVGIPPAEADLLPPLVLSIQEGTAASFPVRFNHAEAYIGEGEGARTALLGDAAHTVHPLAGQGLNLGLADAQSLARCIETAVLRGGDIGSYTALMPYPQERYFENHKIMAVTDKLHKIYRSDLGPVVWARTVGVEVLNELLPLKAAMMFQAGAQSTNNHFSKDMSAFKLLTLGVEFASSGMDLAKSLLKNLGGAANSVFQYSNKLK